MNEIQKEDKTYRYDPDYDCYYRVYTKDDLTHMSRYGWIYVCIVLSVVAWWVSI